jgi:NDP-4-keto-2,6-dideoxyhexose 3-C-methyltransferase
MHREVTTCRVCGSRDLVPILSLGDQALTGVFPRRADEPITTGPLELVKCHDGCGLLQLRHSFDLGEMYGQNYGYRSGLNRSMVQHLTAKVDSIRKRIELRPGDLIVDIGSNDGTLLRAYPADLRLVGIDPTGEKFKSYYPAHITLIPKFFSAGVVSGRARVVTSIAMFYDLESPLEFMVQVRDVLADDGIWVFEQSYMPTMLDVNAYDTICHEHLEYYGLRQIKWMTDRAGLKIIDVELNAINGGSFSVTVAKTGAPYPEATAAIDAIMIAEQEEQLDTPAPYEAFRRRVFAHREELLAFLGRTRAAGKTVLGYGASTKGNVILQFCKLTAADIPCIAEVNSDKFGCITPGTHIPIVSEADAKARKPDYFMVLPWHFEDNIVEREASYLAGGGKLFFPLPALHTVPA